MNNNKFLQTSRVVVMLLFSTAWLTARSPASADSGKPVKVFILSGQSNMVWNLARTDNGATAINTAGQWGLRLWKVGSAWQAARIPWFMVQCHGDSRSGSVWYWAAPWSMVQCHGNSWRPATDYPCPALKCAP